MAAERGGRYEKSEAERRQADAGGEREHGREAQYRLFSHQPGG